MRNMQMEVYGARVMWNNRKRHERVREYGLA